MDASHGLLFDKMTRIEFAILDSNTIVSVIQPIF